MHTLRFDEDFAIPQNKRYLLAPASNITELWQNEEKKRLLRLWSMTDGADEPLFSSYDQFRALCDMMPLLHEHAAEQHCRFFLKRYFDCDDPMDTEHCEEIWHMIAEELLHAPVGLADLVAKKDCPRLLLWDGEAPTSALPNGIFPMLLATALTDRAARSWEEWKKAADRIVERFFGVGCRRVYLSLPDDYTFVPPSLYAVNNALSKERRGGVEQNVLLAQTLRYFSETCAVRGWGIHLRIGACAADAVALLRYTEQTVGLPPLYWSTVYAQTRDAMLTFSAQSHDAICAPIFCVADYPSNAELRLAWDAYTARYPKGLLQIASGGDLADADADRARLLCLIDC